MKIQHRTAIYFSGLSWLMIGGLLAYRGVSYLIAAIYIEREAAWLFSHFPLRFFSNKGAVVALGVAALMLGWVKGRYILSKTVNRVVKRLAHLPSPLLLRQMYTKGYLILMLSMSGLGVCFRFFSLSPDVKGFLDLTIGVALLIGSLIYFRHSSRFKRALV